MQLCRNFTLAMIFLFTLVAALGQSDIDVTWTNVVGASVSGTNLSKTAASGWGNAGAESTNVLQSHNDGYIKFTVGTLSAGEFSFGFSAINVDNNFYTIEYAIHRTTSSLTYVRHHGTSVAMFHVAGGDQLTIERSGSDVIYKKNATVIYAANYVEPFSLLVDASLYNNGGVLGNLKVSFASAPIDWITWGNMVGVTATNAQTLTKTASSGYGNAGASSQNVLYYEEDGWIEFTLDSWNKDRVFGFSDVNSDNNDNSIDFSFRTSGTNIYVYEGNVSHGNIPSAAIGDRFRISRLGSTIYWQRNGFTYYYVPERFRGAMVADVALGTNGAILSNAKCSFGNVPTVNPGVAPPSPEFITIRDLYYKMGGPNWTNYPGAVMIQNWPPISSWPIDQSNIEGHTPDSDDGRVYYVSFIHSNLKGILPRTFWNFKDLRLTNIVGNHIKSFENFDNSIAASNSAYDMNWSSNEIESLPDAFGHFPALSNLRLNHNKLKALPEFVAANGYYPFLELEVYDNELTSLPETVMADEYIMVRVDSNYLDFYTLERIYDHAIGSLTQKKIRDVLEVVAVEGQPLVIPSRPPGGHSTIYWEKLIGSTWTDVLSLNDDSSDETFTRNSPSPSDAGTYRWKMTNSVVTGVTIESEPISVVYKTRIKLALENYGFMYRYDGRKRMIAKKAPGADWTYMVYDNRDRLVMTQDGQQRASKQWAYTRYDTINRAVMTGIYTHTSEITQSAMTALVESTMPSEVFDVEEEENFGYSMNSFASLNQDNFSVLTVTYYDNYDFIELYDADSLAYRPDELGDEQFGYGENEDEYFPFVKGQVTGSVMAILSQGVYALPDENRFIHSVNYYDDKGRIVQSISTNIHATYDVSTNLFDFTGKVLNTRTRQTGLEQHAVARMFQYDHAGRLTKLWHKLDTLDTVLLVMNTYNELGQLVDKGLHNTDDRNATDSSRKFKQSIDYDYNIRGWLTNLNDAALSGTDANASVRDLFGMELFYNVVDPDVGNSAAFNGNISATKWSSSTSGASQRAYKYAYDPMNRLLSARQRVFANDWNDAQAFAERDFSYDLNGNIMALTRMGKVDDYVDSLLYDYGDDGMLSNQLRSVADTYASDAGFKDGNLEGKDYEYDLNGNMVVDRNKGISEITYNHLNLPEKIVTTRGSYIRYVYDAGGKKWQQVLMEAAGDYDTEDDDIIIKTTDYLGEGIYENDKIRLMNHEQGRIVFGETEQIYANVGNETESMEPLSANVYVAASGSESYIVIEPIVVGNVGDVSGIEEVGGVFDVVAGERYTVRLKGALSQQMQVQLRVTIGTSTWQIPVEFSPDWATPAWHDYPIRVDQTGEMGIDMIWEEVTSNHVVYLYGFILEKNIEFAEPEYQYHLKDHLGNVRMTFTTKEETDSVTATLENNHIDEDRANFLNYDKARLIYGLLFDRTNGDSPGYTQRLSGAEGEKIGLAKSISVMPGDIIKAGVYAKYFDVPENPNTLEMVLQTLLIALGNPSASGGAVVDGTGYGTQATTGFPFEMGVGEQDDEDVPKAFLNYIYINREFDESSIRIKFKEISVAALEDGLGGPHEHLSLVDTVKEAGYVYVYLSNDGEEVREVYFDDFKVEHVKSPIIQSDDYYPFGLRYNSYSRENSLINKSKLFQGQEHVDDLGLNWDSFKLRNHQPDIGRFFNVDPLSEKFHYNSPYAFSENKVTAHVELEGAEALDFRTHMAMNAGNPAAGLGSYAVDWLYDKVIGGGVKVYEGSKDYLRNEASHQAYQKRGSSEEEGGMPEFNEQINHSVNKAQSIGKIVEGFSDQLEGYTTVQTLLMGGLEGAAMKGTGQKSFNSFIEGVIANPKGSADDIVKQFTDAGYKATSTTMKSGRGQMVTVEGFSGVNTIKIHGGGGRHGLSRLEISGSGGTYKIVQGARSGYKGNIDEEVKAGTNFIFTQSK